MIRTTLTLDEDILFTAKSLARNRSISLGKVMSDLARKGLAHKTGLHKRNGLPVFFSNKSSSPITLDLVKQDEG